MVFISVLTGLLPVIHGLSAMSVEQSSDAAMAQLAHAARLAQTIQDSAVGTGTKIIVANIDISVPIDVIVVSSSYPPLIPASAIYLKVRFV